MSSSPAMAGGFIGSAQAKTVPIDTAAAGDLTIFTPQVGTRFVCYALWFTAGGATSVTVKSGTNALTGPVPASTTIPNEFKSAHPDLPYFKGRAKGEALIVNNSNAVQLSGAAIVGATHL